MLITEINRTAVPRKRDGMGKKALGNVNLVALGVRSIDKCCVAQETALSQSLVTCYADSSGFSVETNYRMARRILSTGSIQDTWELKPTMENGASCIRM